MRIIAMSASFGKLDGDVLRLEPGLNVIAAPNEWGKSTWCAFLTAMLYGVETRERTTKGQLADKEKYMPWSGRPMEGILRIEHQGRDITIQRRTRGRIPLGEFQAYETHTGLPVPELTAGNCGMVLLGVEKSVFQRTGFIRFDQLAVVPDENLWERLRQSVSSGDENSGSAALGRRLKELKNKCRSPRGGMIPDVQRQIRELENQLQERQNLAQLQQRLVSQAESAETERKLLERHSRVLDYREARANREQTEAAVQAAKDARDAVEKLEKECRDIPVRSELLEKRNRARDLLEELEDIPEKRPPSVLPVAVFGVLCALAVVCAGFFLFEQNVAWAVAGAVMALVFGISAGRVADMRRRQILKQRTEQLKRENRIRDLKQNLALWQVQLALRDDLEQARRTAEEIRVRLESMVATAKRAAAEEQEDELELSVEETKERIESVTERLRQLQLRMGQCQGRAENLPEEETILRRMETERNRLGELERYERALEYGLNALEEAQKELQRRFVPQITAQAQRYLSKLTGGRYDRLIIGQDLSVQAANRNETALRSAQWRSEGTADQMALALRLAIWVRLNPEGPLVLDDALIRFDNDRLKYAMELLKELGEKRQIILFSCQEREKWYC